MKVIDNPMSKESNLQYYSLLLNILDLPVELREWIIRERALYSSVIEDIKDTLINKPEVFFIRNRGLLITAEELDYNKATNLIKLELSDNKLHGIVDGVATYKAIQGYIINSKNPNEAFVRLEIITGSSMDEDEIQQLAISRNA